MSYALLFECYIYTYLIANHILKIFQHFINYFNKTLDKELLFCYTSCIKTKKGFKMRRTVIIKPRWSRDKEYKLQCTIRGMFNNVLTISKRTVKKHGLSSSDMQGFYNDKKNYFKYI